MSKFPGENLVNSKTKAKDDPKPGGKPRPRKTVEGVVLTCGQGDVGQLGLGVDVMEKMRFTLVPGLEKVCSSND